MADRSVGQSGPPYQADKRIVNPTLVTPGPQPIETGDAPVTPHILQGEVVGPRHARARRRGIDPRRKAAAGAILLSATGAATALFMFMGKDARQAQAAPGHDSSSAAPDEPEPKAAALGDSASGDKPLRGSRTSEPAAPAPAAKPATRTPAAPAAEPGAPSSGRQSEPSPSWPSEQEWRERAEAWRQWADEQTRQQAEQPANGQGQGGWGNGQGNGYPGGGNGQPGGGSGPYGQGANGQGSNGQGQGPYGHGSNGQGPGSGPYGGYGGQGGPHGGGPSR